MGRIGGMSTWKEKVEEEGREGVGGRGVWEGGRGRERGEGNISSKKQQHKCLLHQPPGTSNSIEGL